MNDLSSIRAQVLQQRKIIDAMFHQLAIMQQNNEKLLQHFGINELNNNDSIQEIGKSNITITNAINNIGNSGKNNTNVIHHSGNSEANNSNAVLHIGKIEMNKANAMVLGREVKKFFHTNTKKRSLSSTANVILYLHNNPVSSRSELIKASGLSAPGFAKHFLRLRNKGFVKRSSWKEYVLTENAKTIIYKTFHQ